MLMLAMEDNTFTFGDNQILHRSQGVSLFTAVHDTDVHVTFLVTIPAGHITPDLVPKKVRNAPESQTVTVQLIPVETHLNFGRTGHHAQSDIAQAIYFFQSLSHHVGRHLQIRKAVTININFNRSTESQQGLPANFHLKLWMFQQDFPDSFQGHGFSSCR